MWRLQHSRTKVGFSHLLVFIFFYLFYELNSYFRYPYLRIGDAWFDRIFDDTYQVLNSAKCYATIGRSIYDQVTCTYLYGSPLLDFINLLGAHPENVYFVGKTFLIVNLMIFTFFSVYSYNKFGTKRLVLCIIIFISPPFHYLIERGNFDTVIILLILIATVFTINGKFLFGSIVLGIAGIFKFYTLPVLCIYLLIVKFSKGKHLKIQLVVALISATLVLRDFVEIRGILGSGTGGYGGTFGLKSFALYANHFSEYFNTSYVFLFTIMSFILVVLLMFFKFNLSEPIFDKLDSFSGVVKLLFGLQIIVCYLFTINNDYRLSILGIFLSALIMDSFKNSGIEKYILIFGILSMWLSYPSWIFQVLGDLSLFVTICLIIYSLLRSYFELKVNKGNIDSE
jgi:hypothetical protein